MDADLAAPSVARSRRTLDWLLNCPVVPAIACCVFWLLLFGYCSPWNRLLAEIDHAQRLLASGGDYYDKARAFSTPRSDKSILLLFLVVTFLVIKLQIVRVVRSRLAAVLWFITILSIATVSCYLQLEDWSNPHVTILGNWLGSPVILFFVPSLSFGFSLFSWRCNSRLLLTRSAVELIVIPLWAWGWRFFSLIVGLMHS